MNQNKHLILACESGKIFKFDFKLEETNLLYDSQTEQTMMGLLYLDEKMYFSGKDFAGYGQLNEKGFRVEKTVKYSSLMKKVKRRIWYRLNNHQRYLRHREPQFHQMTEVNGTIYISATMTNEVWKLDKQLNLLEKIIIQPHFENFNHLNNVQFDGENYYVCLMRYNKQYGYGGYAKFDQEWNEIERKTLGWESHGFTVIDGDYYILCASSKKMNDVYHPHKAGLIKNGEFVFEHDPDESYCKDFSVDDQNICIVGGSLNERNRRQNSDGFIYILKRTDFNLIKKIIIPNLGGICGCRLPAKDYTNSVQ